jgi:hypothetical protein
MPIEFSLTSNSVHARQSFDSPTVYFDHWAIRTFSDDLDIQDRFVQALMSKGGTFLLSNLSMVEFARAADARHCRDTEAFIERLLPNIFFTDFALDKLLEQERTQSNNQKRFWPTADLSTLKFFCERAQDTPYGFTMHGFISVTHKYGTELVETTDRVAAEIVKWIESIRLDPTYISKTRNSIPNERRPRTKVILGELIRGFVLDHNAPILKNDAIDLLHTFMSVNCCDYVLLDGPWAERVEKMRRRIVNVETAMPIAKCFSMRSNGIKDFLTDLEATHGNQKKPERNADWKIKN